MRSALITLLLWVPCFAADIKADTARLASQLQRFRAYQRYELSAAEWKSIQSGYLAWIDSWLKTDSSVAQMNAELQAAKLLSDGPQTVDEMFDKTYAGLLGRIESKPIRGVDDLFAITFGVHTGGYCNRDQTLVLYSRKPLKRVALINAEAAYEHGFLLRDFAVGKSDPSGGRIVGSAWVASNCTSNWNGNIFRIDRSRGPSIENILSRGMSAFGGQPVEISIENDTVTFGYSTGMGDSVVRGRAGIARYRVQGGRAIRQAPIAASFGGFLDEWLQMDDAEAARWSTPEAGLHHHDLTYRSEEETFAWEHVADCPGPPLAREIAIHWKKSNQTTVFLISGSSAAEMRVSAVSEKLSPSCRAIDISADLSSIIAQPPQ